MCGALAHLHIGVLHDVFIVVTYLCGPKADALGGKNWSFAFRQRPTDVTFTEIRSRDAPRARNRCRLQAGFLTSRVNTLRPAFPTLSISGMMDVGSPLTVAGAAPDLNRIPFYPRFPSAPESVATILKNVYEVNEAVVHLICLSDNDQD